MISRKRIGVRSLLLAAVAAVPLQAFAGTFTWDGGSPLVGGNSNWSTAANWATNVAAQAQTERRVEENDVSSA